MISVRLGPDLRNVVVWTPSYFERFRPPATPYDLDRHACIGYRLTTSGGLLPWECEKDGKEIKIRTNGPLIANNGDLPAAVFALARASATSWGMM